MSGAELLDYQRTAAINAGVDPDDPTGTYYRPYELLNRPQTNWMDHFHAWVICRNMKLRLREDLLRRNFTVRFHTKK